MTTLMLKPGDSITIESLECGILAMAPDTKIYYDEDDLVKFATFLTTHFVQEYHRYEPTFTNYWINEHLKAWKGLKEMRGEV